MNLGITVKSVEGTKRLTINLDGTQEEVIEAYQMLIKHYREKKFIVVDPV